MGDDELQAELDTEIALANRALEERAKAIQLLQEMAEAARCLSEGFSMTIKFHNLEWSRHQKAFSRYNKVRKLYEQFCVGAEN